MKYTYLIFGICLGCLFTACKPDFDLNAPYKDVTVVYGILSYQDTVHYVKIYKGFQSHKVGGVYIDAQNPDSIYYYDKIDVVIQEYNKDKRTSRPDIKLRMVTNEIPKEDGIFYSGDATILYKTEAQFYKNYSYKIKITNKITKQVTEGMTHIVDDFNIIHPQSLLFLTRSSNEIAFTRAPFASDSCYEFHVSMLYFEVDNETKKVTKQGKISKTITFPGETYRVNTDGYFTKSFPSTFYDDLAENLKPNPNVTRYLGIPYPDDPLAGSHSMLVEGWAVGASLKNFLVSNKPTSSFVQVNTIYTNMKVTEGDGLAFGFFSSKVQCHTRTCGIDTHSEDSLVKGSKTRHLGFRYRYEFIP